MVKNLILSILLSVGLVLGTPVLAVVGAEEFNSQVDCQGITAESEFCKEKNNETNTLFGSEGILTNVITFLNIVIGIAAVATIIFAGYRFINSNGDPQKVATARNTVIYGVAGVALAAMSQLIVAFVVTRI